MENQVQLLQSKAQLHRYCTRPVRPESIACQFAMELTFISLKSDFWGEGAVCRKRTFITHELDHVVSTSSYSHPAKRNSNKAKLDFIDTSLKVKQHNDANTLLKKNDRQ